jgi:hypothetical protein
MNFNIGGLEYKALNFDKKKTRAYSCGLLGDEWVVGR